MRTWEDRVRTAGAELINNAGIIAHLEPDAESLVACVNLGKEGI